MGKWIGPVANSCLSTERMPSEDKTNCLKQGFEAVYFWCGATSENNSSGSKFDSGSDLK